MRNLWRRLLAYSTLLLASLAVLWAVSIRMPGASYSGVLPPLTAGEESTQVHLTRYVTALAGAIGERGETRLASLDSAASYIRQSFEGLGHSVAVQPYEAKGKRFQNLEVTIPGRRTPEEVVLVGAHYDTYIQSPGADDNSSGTAAVLELARLLKGSSLDRTVRLVAFVNEEPPFFYHEDMGSRHYARAARARGDKIIAMVSLETIGYYSDAEGSQHYPPVLGWFYPSRGDFIAFVGNVGSRGLVHRAIGSFRANTRFPSQGAAAWGAIPGISWSDHWSFWKEGYDAVMITDTAPFRNPHYHEASDTPTMLDYARMSRVVTGVARVVADLATR